MHSLHAYFLRPGDPPSPIVYDVERIRDGRSFTTRRVRGGASTARPIFALSASFQLTRPASSTPSPLPPACPAPEDLPDLGEWLRGDADVPVGRAAPAGPALRRGAAVVGAAAARPPTRPQRVWMRADGTLPDDPLLHVCLLTYASDLTLLASVLVPHGAAHRARLQLASLDHAMWFHRPFRADEWLLYECQARRRASGARGLATGRVFTQDGRLVATVVQEGLVRVPDARAAPDDESGLGLQPGRRRVAVGEAAQQGFCRAAVPGDGPTPAAPQQHEPHPDGQQGRLRDRQPGARGPASKPAAARRTAPTAPGSTTASVASAMSRSIAPRARSGARPNRRNR